jgi:DNA (cytosine-5)-methyltransferase 1
MEQTSLFDFLPDDEAARLRPKKSTDWKWSFKDYPKEKNGLKVFSCFACGGGSTMGYKLAGCEVIGCCEIDPKMNGVYIKNHNPKHNFCMDIRKFNEIPNEELPEELFNLDILDGSPPCTTFSMAGDREDSWGKKKKFREGQAEQTLDDLSFIFIDTVAKLRPYCVIMENVEGLIKGEAWSYVQRIYKQFNEIGYKVKHWLLNGENMGVPQSRHRVFFIALREDVDFDLYTLDMSFNYEPIPFKLVKEGNGGAPSEKAKQLLRIAEPTDKNLGDVVKRTENRVSMFNIAIVWDDDICPTIHNHGFYRGNDKVKFSLEDYRNTQTFPEDYQFESIAQASYICGMSVPPIMIKRIVTRLIESGVFKRRINNDN